MSNFRRTIFYSFSLLFIAIVVYVVQKYDFATNKLLCSALAVSENKAIQNDYTFLHIECLGLLLSQILLIVCVAKLFGWLCSKINQPSVIGEMIAGIALGPTIFGWLFPTFSTAIFPLESIPTLQFLSQIGLMLFMFIIGMDVDFKVLKSQAKDAIMISHASIIFPFGMGLMLAIFIYENFAPANIDFISFALFIAVAMSITAFPVLASIMKEKKMQHTPLGNLVLICAAADDVTAWILLAIVIAIVKASGLVQVLISVCLTIAYVLFMLKIVRPRLLVLVRDNRSTDKIPKYLSGIFLVLLIASSFISEIIGIHALFGAFLAGVIIPDIKEVKLQFAEKVEDFATIILLPLFFVCTGLRTELNFGLNYELWTTTLFIIFVAIIGKLLGAAITAKFIGKNWKESLIIGVLMNTRGLMELVVLNIGLDLGVLSKEIFSMMVVMTIITTIMTGPLLKLIMNRDEF